MAPTMTRQGGRKSFIFMQDNAPVHTAKKIYDFLERNGYDVLDHPAQSPDLNPLENIWWAIEEALLDKPFLLTLMTCLTKLKKYGTTIPPMNFLSTSHQCQDT